MRFDVITLFPEMIDNAARTGVTGKAVEKGIVELKTWNPRNYTHDNHRTVDDSPYGGGPGMVMKYEPVFDAIQAAKKDSAQSVSVVFLSPQGRQLTQQIVGGFSERSRIILLCGRYEGIDERLLEAEVDEEWSLGDYVISGGELAALVVIDAVTRLLPDVLGDKNSAQQDSHMGGLLDYPHYTRPEQIAGQNVPDVLLGGNHGQIEEWRMKQALGRTWMRRNDLLERLDLNDKQQRLLAEFITEFKFRQTETED